MDSHGSESELSGDISVLHEDCSNNTLSAAQRYIGNGSTSYKRRMDDDGRWWLPVDTSSARWTRWPSSHTTMRGRAGQWTRSTDPWRADDNLHEHLMNKELLKTLTLTSDAELIDEPPGDTEDRRDEVQRAGAGHGARQPGADDEHEGSPGPC